MKFFKSEDSGRTFTHDGETLRATEGGQTTETRYVSEQRVRRELNVTEVDPKER